ncbi:hypothetical protein ABL78_2806 [Leptomonas seymouri]|uniref:Uncharacterized protein n=1 Tax=Leptomonas seymouri TaxID=5684 RepID=A0A0N0P6X5_LEPSE|nr:hypothetical protein ABL78_2806 [Leptomonas seymouri]|eukprot:KPI88119.1 hypothetical protein ABL78_2806 [Leptomonas seymouri]
MDALAESPQRLIEPPTEPSAPQSHAISKTTVTSANLASVGETNLVASVGSIVANEKPLQLNASTPRRRHSFLDQQQPTSLASLQWPSTHRSFSSAAATRDSSRHSQATDRVNTAGGLNVSATISVHGRAPSSACHTPMSSRDGHSDYRSSAMGVVKAGGMRRGRSLGPHHPAPPLVDLVDSPSQGPQSASHSICTTTLCTPRDYTSMVPGHGRHPSPFGGHNISATLSISARNDVTSAPPPLDDFEAEALALSRAELEEKVEQMRGDNLVLRTSVLRLREALATLKEGLRANYADIERRQDSIANMLLRRLEATKRHRTRLLAHLRKVEMEKASQEKKLVDTKQSIKDLSKHLKREEQEIAERLQGRLRKLHAQREQLSRVLEEQTSSLQQLEQFIRQVEEMVLGDGVEGGGGNNTNAVVTVPSVLVTADAPASDAASTSAPTLVPAGPPQGRGGSSASVNILHERSSSRASATSSTAGATAADVAYDPNAMIRYLEEEIAAAEGLRSDALKKADEYVATRERLERRLERERKRKAEQASRTEALRQELRSASTAVNRKIASQETAFEMEVDRHLNSCRAGGDLASSASSACATPRMRAMSAAASRGNSTSPCVDALATTTCGAAARPDTGDNETRIPPPPTDPFMLSGRSFNSGLPTSVRGHAEAPRATGCPTGMVVGDGAAPHMSFSSGIHMSISHDEITASSEETPHAARLLVQETSRMAAPRPVTSTESTPRRTPPPTPQLSTSQGPVV